MVRRRRCAFLKRKDYDVDAEGGYWVTLESFHHEPVLLQLHPVPCLEDAGRLECHKEATAVVRTVIRDLEVRGGEAIRAQWRGLLHWVHAPRNTVPSFDRP